MLITISVISAALTLFYIWLMLYYRKGWKATPLFDKTYEPQKKVTVIVPARNEEGNIHICLEHLHRQTYPRHLFEVIVVDDHSTDATFSSTEKFKRDVAWNDLQILLLAKIPGKRYKKAAITEAIKIAQGEIIITTDADCTMDKYWLSTIVSFFEHTGAAFVSAPVMFAVDRKLLRFQTNFFLHWQQLEFAGLVGIGAAALQNKFPNMCNGANIAYRRQVFDEVGGYTGNDGLLSGDDEFLMHKIFTRYPDKVFFLKSPQAIVRTAPAFYFKEFMAQRMRWVSKSTKYSDKRITLVLSLAYLFNLSIVISLVAGVFCSEYLWLFAGQIAAKVLAEYFFYSDILRFFRLQKRNRIIIPAQPFHILYVLAIGILGNFVKYNWKGRTQ